MDQKERIQYHLGLALRYANEVVTSYDMPEFDDVRAELLGSLGSAERDLSSFNTVLFKALTSLREKAQSKRMYIDYDDLYTIKDIYMAVDDLMANPENVAEFDKQNKIKFNITDDNVETVTANVGIAAASLDEPDTLAATLTSTNIDTIYNKPLDVIYFPIKNDAWFDYSVGSIRTHFKNIGEIYVIDCPESISRRKHVKKFESFDNISDNFIFMSENMGVVRDYDALQLYPSFNESCPREKLESFNNIKNRLVEAGINDMVYVWDNIRPQPINKEKWIHTQNTFKDDDLPLTAFYSYTRADKYYVGLKDITIISKRICCATRVRIRTTYFITWTTDDAFDSLLDSTQLTDFTIKS